MDYNVSLKKIMLYGLTFLCFVISTLYNQVELGFSLVLLLFIFALLITIDNLEKHFILFFFLCTFFLFLLSSYTLYEYFGWTENVIRFNHSIRNHIYLCLSISLIALLVGYNGIVNLNIKSLKLNKKLDQGRDDMIFSIRFITLFFLILFFIPNIYVSLVQYQFISRYGYAETYLSNSVQVSYLISLTAYSFPIMYYVYLSTLPSKKGTIFPTILYIISSCLTLLSGQRATFVINILVLLIYYFFRNNESKDTKWISKRFLLFIFILSPVIAILLYLYGQIRFVNNLGDFSSLTDLFFNTLSSQGISISVIGYERIHENTIPNKIYSLGGIIEFLKYNPLTSFISGAKPLLGQSQERAFNGNLFTHIISYLVLPYNYLRGRGLGSSYIAEAYHDFGYIGVFIWSYIYGRVMRFFNSFLQVNIFLRAFILISLHGLLFSPRSVTDGFISCFLNSQTFFSFFIILGSYIIITTIKKIKG